MLNAKYLVHTLLVLLIFLIISLFYKEMFNGFFQQDEWLAFNRLHLLSNKDTEGFLQEVFKPSLGHYTPLALLTLFSSYSLFQLNYIGYAVLSLFMHLLVVAVVYLLCLKIFKNILYAFLGALLFGVYAAGYQGTAWVIANIGTHGASLTGLFSLFFFLNFLETKNNKNFIVSNIFLILSLLFKEITLGLYPFYLLLLYLNRKDFKSEFSKSVFIVLSSGFIYVLLRFMMFLSPASKEGSHVSSPNQLLSFIQDLFIFPIKSLIQTLVPQELLLFTAQNIGERLVKVDLIRINVNNFDLFVQGFLLQNITIFLFSMFLVFLFFSKRYLQLKQLKIVLLSLAFILINSLIFVMSPERQSLLIFVDSRNLYFLSFGAIVLILSLLRSVIKKDLLIVFLLILLTLANGLIVRDRLKQFSDNAQVREGILKQIESENPDLPSKVIFLTESDRSFYNLPNDEEIMPFQSGFGQTLLTWYSSRENFPEDYFKNRFLWEIREQGYREVGDSGFGYYRKRRDFINAAQEFGFEPESVIAYKYSSKDNKLENNTQEIKGIVRGISAPKREVKSTDFKITLSENNKDSKKVIDKDLDTYWQSDLPIKSGQLLELDFYSNRKIAHIKLNAYNETDQERLGFEVSIKVGNEWKVVFRSEKYRPNEKGIVDIYIEPELTDSIKITQLGMHPISHWKIHEIEVYEEAD